MPPRLRDAFRVHDELYARVVVFEKDGVRIALVGADLFGMLRSDIDAIRERVKEAGIDTEKWYERDEIIKSNDVFFCATGITTGLMLEGVERTKTHYKVQTMMITGATGERQILTSYMPSERLASIAARDVA